MTPSTNEMSARRRRRYVNQLNAIHWRNWYTYRLIVYECVVHIQMTNSGLIETVHCLTPILHGGQQVARRDRSRRREREAGETAVDQGLIDWRIDWLIDWRVQITPQATQGFWPRRQDEKERAVLCARYLGQAEFTLPFPYTETLEVRQSMNQSIKFNWLTVAIRYLSDSSTRADRPSECSPRSCRRRAPAVGWRRRRVIVGSVRPCPWCWCRRWGYGRCSDRRSGEAVVRSSTCLVNQLNALIV